MNFGAAVASVFSNYANFSGRARRSEYWWWYLLFATIGIAVSIADRASGTRLWLLVLVPLLLPHIAVTIRRLHDTRRSAWWFVFGLIPVLGTITILVYNSQDSEPGTNEYGTSPKYPLGEIQLRPR